MNTRILRSIPLLVAGSLLAVSCGSDDSSSTTEAPVTEAPATEAPTTEAPMTEAPAPTMDIVDTAVAAGSFNTLAAALTAADLVDTLKGEGPFTVFAPTDEAFEAALAALGMTAEELLADKELLTSILLYHVVAGEVPAADVVGLNGQDVATVNGATVRITVEGSSVKVNDANVVTADVFATNGVIHVIDAVLVPSA